MGINAENITNPGFALKVLFGAFTYNLSLPIYTNIQICIQ